MEVTVFLQNETQRKAKVPSMRAFPKYIFLDIDYQRHYFKRISEDSLVNEYQEIKFTEATCISS